MLYKFKTGEVYQGDTIDIMERLPDASIDMILCDLPYVVTDNNWDKAICLDRLWGCYERLIKPRGAIVLTAQQLFSVDLINSKRNLFRNKLVWVKSNPTGFLNAQRNPLRQHEDILVFSKEPYNYYPVMWKGTPYVKDRENGGAGSSNYNMEGRTNGLNQDGSRFPTDVVYCTTAQAERGGKTLHPTQKPVALGRYLIRMFSQPGDVVLDNTCGSGSFLVSAVFENRQFIGIEQNGDYVQIAKDRIDQAYHDATAVPELFDSLHPSGKKTYHSNNRIQVLEKIIGK